MLGTALGLELVPDEGEQMGSRGYMKREARNTSCLLGVTYPLGLNSPVWRTADKVTSEVIPHGSTGVVLPVPFSVSF